MQSRLQVSQSLGDLDRERLFVSGGSFVLAAVFCHTCKGLFGDAWLVTDQRLINPQASPVAGPEMREGPVTNSKQDLQPSCDRQDLLPPPPTSIPGFELTLVDTAQMHSAVLALAHVHAYVHSKPHCHSPGMKQWLSWDP